MIGSPISNSSDRGDDWSAVMTSHCPLTSTGHDVVNERESSRQVELLDDCYETWNIDGE